MPGIKKVTLLLFLTVNIILGSEVSESQPCGIPADVAFLIDSSRSINSKDYAKQIEFVQEIVGMFEIGPDATHIAALTFADKTAVEFYFGEYESSEAAKERIGNIAHANGGATYTHNALKSMREDIFTVENGMRTGVPKIGILLTDGRSTSAYRTQKEANLTKAAGINILAVGIGSINRNELETLVSPPSDKNFLYRKSFDELKSEATKKLVAQTACAVIETTTTTTTTTTPTTTTTEPTTTTTTTKKPTTTEPPPTTSDMMMADQAALTCQGKEADVILLVDMSSSIWSKHFDDELHFLADLIGIFDIDSGKTRVGLVAFSDNAEPKFYLNDFKNNEDIRNAILKVKSEGGITNTHLALQTLIQEMLKAKHGSRPDVAHICILITDGRSSKPELTLPEAQLVHKSGVNVFAIGVGNMTDFDELKLMASKPEFAYDVDSYDMLKYIRYLLAYKACEVPQGDQPQCAKNLKADIMFGLYGIGGEDRNKVTDFMKKVGGAFDLESGNVKIGLNEDCGKAMIKLQEFGDKEYFSTTVDEVMGTEISTLLGNLRRSFGFSRKDADKVVILVVSGKLEGVEEEAFYETVQRFKHGNRVIVVGVGKGTDKSQLEKLATYKDNSEPDDSHVFMVDDSDDLLFEVKKIHHLMCNAQ